MYPGRLYTRDIMVLYPPGSDQCIQVDYIPGISRFYILKVQINVSRKIICHGYQGSVSSRFRSRYPGRLFTRDIKVLYPPGSDQCIQVDYMPWISMLYILRFRSMYPGRLYTRDIKVLYPPGSDQCIQVDYTREQDQNFLLELSFS